MRRSQPKWFLHEFQALKTEQLIHNKYLETHKMSNEDLKQGYPKIIIKDSNFRKTKPINSMLNIFTPIAYIKQVVVNGIMQENKKKKTIPGTEQPSDHTAVSSKTEKDHSLHKETTKSTKVKRKKLVVNGIVQ